MQRKTELSTAERSPEEKVPALALGSTLHKAMDLASQAGKPLQPGHPVGEKARVGQNHHNGRHGNLHSDNDGRRFPGSPGPG